MKEKKSLLYLSIANVIDAAARGAGEAATSRNPFQGSRVAANHLMSTPTGDLIKEKYEKLRNKIKDYRGEQF